MITYNILADGLCWSGRKSQATNFASHIAEGPCGTRSASDILVG
jgi:hypothetical protein